MTHSSKRDDHAPVAIHFTVPNNNRGTLAIIWEPNPQTHPDPHVPTVQYALITGLVFYALEHACGTELGREGHLSQAKSGRGGGLPWIRHRRFLPMRSPDLDSDGSG